MTLTSVTSRMSSAIARSRQKDMFLIAAKGNSTVLFSSLTAKNTRMQGIDEASDRENTQARVQFTMSPFQADNARQYGTSSIDESPQHVAACNAAKEIATIALTPNEKRSGWSTLSASKDNEFDPILNIRALNPLIFESNYELEEYGPSYRGKEDEHAVEIQELRIRRENLA